MRVVFRTDASSRIGGGHLARCLTLARELHRRDADVRFVVGDHDEGWYGRLQQAGFVTHPLARQRHAGRRVADGDYAAWVGVSEAQDADETLAVTGADVDVLIVDHYGLGEGWESRVRAEVGSLMAIDDLADRTHQVDILLDQNLRSDGGRSYRDLVPGSSVLLVGPAHALIDPAYRQARSSSHRGEGTGRVLVALGSAPGADLLQQVTTSLLAVSGAVQEVHVVDPMGHLGAQGSVTTRTRLVRHGQQPDLIEHLAGADVVVGAGGGTSWERACLGAAAATMSLAANQKPILQELAAFGAVVYLGDASDDVASTCGDAVVTLLRDGDRREGLRSTGRWLVDGYGVQRVAELLVPSTPRLSLREADHDDVGIVWHIANDVEVRAQAVQRDPIGWASHVAWFAARLASPDCEIYLLEAAGAPVGLVRFDIDGRTATIDYALVASARGRGWGRVLIELGIDHLLGQRKAQVEVLEAYVREGNRPSLRVLEAAGFERRPSSYDPPLVRLARSGSAR